MWVVQLQRITQQIAVTDKDSADTDEKKLYQKLAQKQKILLKKVASYHLHLKQYETCREECKQAEAQLVHGDGRCVLYRDFVNQYNEEGRKVNNLVLVKITRGENGELAVEKLHNFSTDKLSGCDAYFVADVFAHHLTP